MMITTIIRNLLSNAIKYTKEGGKITISAKEKDEYIVVSVADTGIGIKPEQLDNLFHETNSITTLGTNNEKGTGLGLALCKEFTEKHNGKIWAESEIEKGTIFHFTIPLNKDKESN